MHSQRWGVTGWSNTWKALGSDIPDDDDDSEAVTLVGYGFEREMVPGVVYRAVAAPVPGVPEWHVKPGSGGRILQMPWPEDAEPTTRSLLDLQAEIAPRRQGIKADDPALATLDTAIDQVLAAASDLHAAGRSLGYLQPDSCRVGAWRDGRPFVMLPDVGFAWDKAIALMVPHWLAEPDLELLFDAGAAERNDRCLAELARVSEGNRTAAAEASEAELADVRLLARLITVALVGVDEARRWCTGKKTLARLPAKDVAPDTQAEIWDKVIAPALDGQIRTCAELRARLATDRPSSHFLHVPPAPPWAGWAVLRWAALAGCCLASIGLLWLGFDSLRPWLFPPRAPFCTAATKDDPIYDKLVDLKRSRDAARGNVAKRPAFWSRLEDCLAEHAAFEPCGGQQCLDGVVDEWLRQAEEEGTAVRERLRSRPEPTAAEVRGLTAAITAIQQAERHSKRSASPAVVDVLTRELRLRGGQPPTPLLPERNDE